MKRFERSNGLDTALYKTTFTSGHKTFARCVTIDMTMLGNENVRTLRIDDVMGRQRKQIDAQDNALIRKC